MTNDEQESILTLYPNDHQILTKLIYPDIKSVVRLFFVVIFYMLIVGVFGGVLLIGADALQFKSPLLSSLLNLLLYIIALLLTIRYVARKNKKQTGNVFNISFNKIQGWLVPIFIISTLALVVGLERISALVPMPASVEKFFEATFTKDIFSIINLVIAAPILEEILCRGLVLKGLLKNYQPYRAILISAIFFAAIHLNPWQALPAFFGGLFLGWVYYKTQSVIPGMIIHATVNASAALFLFLPRNQQDFLSLLGMHYYIMLCLGSILIFTAGCIIIHKKALALVEVGTAEQ